MKKILSLALAALMVTSVLPVAYATTDYTNGTEVAILGELTDENGIHSESYTVTVPARLNPGQTGYVTCSGYFPTGRSLTVTADDKVTLYNTLNGNTTTLDVTMNVINVDGDDLQQVSNGIDGEPITLEELANGHFLFGQWGGLITYEAFIGGSMNT